MIDHLYCFDKNAVSARTGLLDLRPFGNTNEMIKQCNGRACSKCYASADNILSIDFIKT